MRAMTFVTRRSASTSSYVCGFLCLLMLLAGISQARPDDAALDTSRLPRISGAKEVYASALTTIFTSPDPVIATAGTIDKALATAGWQKYGAPFAATVDDPNMRMMSFKKGQQALGVFITLAPAQANATSVQYNAVPLKNDLPFTNDASNIVYAPDRPTLSLVTAEPIDKTLDFYRKELGVRGWSLWSRKLNAKEAPDGPSGVAQERGAYAHYVSESKPKVALVLTLQAVDGGKFKVELKEWPIGILAPEEAKPVAGAPLEAGPELARLPAPIEGTGSSNASERSMTANINADVDAVLAFYRRELTARNWKEESQGTAIAADRATVAFSTADGTAVLKLARESDLTSISLVQKIVKPPVAKDESIDAIMKQALQMATQAEALSGSPSTRTAPANEPTEALQALAGSDAPVPLPNTATDIELGTASSSSTALPACNRSRISTGR
jgi:catechol 2,3-dioxygenase-like lactoylglutathione lyase family enzyme